MPQNAKSRGFAILLSAAATLVLAGCVGDTDAATHVRATRAQLNAHGHTNNGPAKWWWEWSDVKSKVANGQGTRTPTQGPASSATDVNLNAVITGLDSSQPYYFRACGQDTASSSATCGQIRRFRTSPGDSTVKVVQPGGGSAPYVNVVAATNVVHQLQLTVPATGPVSVYDRLDDTTNADPPFYGSTWVPGTGCTADYDPSKPGQPSFDTTATCGSAGTAYSVVATLGPYNDLVNTTFGNSTATTVHGGAGDDSLRGGDGPDQLYGDANNDDLRGYDGDDYLRGGAGDDFLDSGAGVNILQGGPGNDTYFCDSTADIALVDSPTESANAQSHGCTAQVDTSANRRAALRKWKADTAR